MTFPPPRDLSVKPSQLSGSSILQIISSALLWLIVGLCCLLPLGWLIVQISFHPSQILSQLRVDSFRAMLLLRTLAYNGSVGVLACLLAIPAAWALGRGRGILSAALWFVLPISLLMPSLVIAYGWKQFLRMFDCDPAPAGFIDISRCVWTLATWLWPVPAILIGMSLRRSDSQVQQQAVLDGILRRVMLRQMLAPIIASICIVSMLAMQEFAVYEPTGISVVATETRMVFETGAFSSSLNPIIAPMTGTATGLPPSEQAARAAGAVGTALPMLLVVFLLGCIALLSVRKFSSTENVDVANWPRVLDAPIVAILFSWLAVGVTLVIPIASLILSLKRSFILTFVWEEYHPQVMGTIFISGITGIIALLLALCASPKLRRLPLAGALLSFLIGGQILAISLIWVYNRPWPEWVQNEVYNGWPLIVMAYIGRFGWIVLGAAMMTWSEPWKQLRDLASIDGADAMRTARHVVWPIAWPILLASSIFVLILSLSEVPATVLISPQRPQVLVPMLMTWVHMLRYDAMIEASLLIAGVVVALGLAAIVLGWFGIRVSRLVPIMLLGLLPMLAGCRDRTKPEAIWCSTGTGPAQVVYPRGISYSATDDTFYIVDREARIQHLDSQGKCLDDWRMPQWEQGKPVGISAGPDGNLYVPDTHYNRMIVYTPDGKTIREFGSKGTGPGQFIYPTDVAFDARGNIYISEYGDNDRIQVFDKNLNYLYQFGKFGNQPGEFSRPQSIVIDGETIYVTDACNHRIEVFKTDGTFLRTLGKVGGELGEFRFPYGLDMDNAGHLVVCEFGNNRVQLIDKQTGKGLKTWGLPGREPGELAYPWGVAVDKRGRVVAVDAGNNRLQVFEF